MDPSDRFVRLRDVIERTGLSRSTIYRLVSLNEFPPKVTLGATTVAWLESEVQAWMDAREQTSERPPWSPPASPPQRIREPKLPPLAPNEKGAEAAAKIAGVVGIAVDPDEVLPDVDIALRFPDWPQMMRRRTAAAYLDLTESAFIREVYRNTLPMPVLLGGRESWSRQAIDRALADYLSRKR